MKRRNGSALGRDWLFFVAALAGLALLYGAPRLVLAGLVALLVLGVGFFAVACLASGFAQADPDHALRRSEATGNRLPQPRKSATW